MFYKKSLIDKYGPVPSTWNEFIAYCVRLKKLGYEIFPVSNKQPWLAVGWFEYFVLRMQGEHFYRQLVNGHISYHDVRVKKILAKWQKMIQLGLFSDKYVEYTWEEYTPAFVRGHFVFVFMSNNFIHRILDDRILEDIGYMAFPKIEDIPRYESSPTSLFYLNQNSSNKKNAEKFLAFIAKPENQSFIANGLFTLPVNRLSEAPENVLVHKAHQLLNDATAITPFFDRVIPSELDKPAAEALNQFVLEGDIEKVSYTLEALRTSIYKIKSP